MPFTPNHPLYVFTVSIQVNHFFSLSSYGKKKGEGILSWSAARATQGEQWYSRQLLVICKWGACGHTRLRGLQGVSSPFVNLAQGEGTLFRDADERECQEDWIGRGNGGNTELPLLNFLEKWVREMGQSGRVDGSAGIEVVLQNCCSQFYFFFFIFLFLFLLLEDDWKRELAAEERGCMGSVAKEF